MLLARLASAVVLVPIVLAVTWQGGPLFAVVAAMAASWSALEYARLLERGGVRLAWPVAVVGAGCLTIAPAVPGSHLGALALGAIVLAPGLFYLADGTPFAQAVAAWAQTALVALLVGWPLAQAVALRLAPGDGTLFGVELARGALLVLVALTLTWASDTAAYAVGRLMGQRRFFPSVSPKKSQEGALAGVLSPCVIGLLWSGPLGWPLVFGAVLGAACGVAAIAGDLLESMLKRAVGAKDAGAIIPGHGGLLDRIDGLLLVFATVALLTGEVWP